MQEIRASDIIKALTQDVIGRNKNRRPILPLHNARIWGELNLKHRTIDSPVGIRDCEFKGEVDLRLCEFNQIVDFSGCTFQRELNSGDEVESHTVYKTLSSRQFYLLGAVVG